MSKLKAFEVDDGCQYTIAARNVRDAINVYYSACEDAGCLEYPEEEGFTVEPLSEARLKVIEIDVDGETFTAEELLAKATESTVLGCSEW